MREMQSVFAVDTGDLAPPFTLRSPAGAVSLRERLGRPLVLAFYQADWAPVCAAQLRTLAAAHPAIVRAGADVFAVSVDGVWSHRAFGETLNLPFPLLSDFEPKGAVSRAYGVYRRDDGTSERALFVLDEVGAIKWRHLHAIDDVPGVEGVLDALDTLARARTAAVRAVTDGSAPST